MHSPLSCNAAVTVWHLNLRTRQPHYEQGYLSHTFMLAGITDHVFVMLNYK